MKYFNKINLPTFLNAQKDLDSLIDNKIIKWHHKQICLNCIGSTDDPYLGTGSLYYDWDKIDISLINSKNDVPVKDVIYNEEDFTELCTKFKNTVFEEMYLLLKTNYKLGRVRLMKSMPKTCLSWHVDDSKRLHYPIITNDGCFMIIKDETLHLESNNWYLTNTTVEHTALNASFSPRVHLVATILD
jgi:hypothetical protein